MKQLYLFLFFVFMGLCTYADPDEIVLGGGNQQPDRTLPDKPYVFYDNDTQEIILYGTGVVGYYDVEICSAGTGNVEISTVVGGTYDTIDVSSLTAGSHVITIESPSGNIYEGTFTTY